MNSKKILQIQSNLHQRFVHLSSLLFLLFLLFAIASQATAQQPDSLWTKMYGGADYDRGHSMIQTSDGGFALIGEYGGYKEFDFLSYRTQGKVWFVKTDELGDTLWTKTYARSDYDLGNAVRQTSDGGYIIAGATSTGQFSTIDAWLIRTDAFGDTLWTKTYGMNGADSANDIIETSDGGFVFTGFTDPKNLLRTQDAWLVKTDSIGDTLWTSRFYSGDKTNIGNKVQETVDGGYVVTGTTQMFGVEEDLFLFRTDGYGEELWTKTYNTTFTSSNGTPRNDVNYGQDIIELENDGFMVLGSTGSAKNWLLRTDTDGDTLGTKKFFGYGRSFKQTTDGGFIIIGDWLVRTDSAGDTLWTKSYLGGFSNSVVQTSDGGYAISGYALNYSNNRLEDLWIFRLGPEGAVTTNQPDIEVPGTATLHQNYPNPFNPATVIPYDLPESAHVKIEIFDMLGRRLTTLIDGMTPAGSHQVRFDAGQLSSGIYLVRLETGSFTASRKLTLMK